LRLRGLAWCSKLFIYNGLEGVREAPCGVGANHSTCQSGCLIRQCPAPVTPVIHVVRVDIAHAQPMELEFKEGDWMVVVYFRN